MPRSWLLSAFEAIRPHDPHYIRVIQMTSEVLSPKGKHGSITAPSSLPRMAENI